MDRLYLNLARRVGELERVENATTGSFTPQLTSSDLTGANFSWSAQLGRHTRIGNLVTCEIRVVVSAFVSAPTGGQLRVTNLPFTSANVTGGGFGLPGAGAFSYLVGLSGVAYAYVPPNVTYVEFYNTAGAIISGNVISATSNIGMVVTYLAA